MDEVTTAGTPAVAPPGDTAPGGIEQESPAPNGARSNGATGDAAAPAAPRRRLWRRAARVLPAVASVAVGTVLIWWHAARFGSWLIDDAGITFAYARSFDEGLGPVLQPGADPVEGFSNPAWTVLLALGRRVGLFDHGTLFGTPDYVLFPKAVALLLCAGILAITYRAATRVTRHPWVAPIAVGVLLAANPSFVIWAFSGLENPLYAFVVVSIAVLGFVAVVDGRLLTARVAVGMGALAALAALTRPEGMVYAAVYPLVVLLRLRRPTLLASALHTLLSVATFVVPVGGYVLWRHATFDRWVSAPAIAKEQGMPKLTDFTRASALVEYVGALAIILAVLLVGMALSRPSTWRDGVLALLVPLGLAVVAYSVLERDWMAQFRFGTPIWALGSLTAVLAAVGVLGSTTWRSRVWVAAAIVAVLLPSAVRFRDHSDTFHERPDISTCYVADRFGRTFNAYADILDLDEASLLIPDLGGSSMTSRLELVDVAGLTNYRFAELVNDDDRRGQADYVFRTLRPTFIHTREPWTSGNGIGWDKRMARDYIPIHHDIFQDAPHGDWVRKDAVPDAAALWDLRAYAARHTDRIERSWPADPLQACGDRLARGQTVTGRSS